MRIHRNLHNAKRGGPQWTETVSGKVARYLETVTLVDVSTRIRPAAARKCLETNVRRVCAFLDGTEATAPTTTTTRRAWCRLGYDPRKDASFLADGRPWTHADAVELRADGSGWVLNPRQVSS